MHRPCPSPCSPSRLRRKNRLKSRAKMPLPTRHGAKLKNSAAPRAAKRKNRAARALPLSGSVQGRMKILCRAGQLLRRHTVHLQGQRAKPALFKRPQRRMHRLRGPLPRKKNGKSRTHSPLYRSRLPVSSRSRPLQCRRARPQSRTGPQHRRLCPKAGRPLQKMLLMN